MAQTTSFTFRLDKDLKEQSESLYSNMGMNLSTALNIFLKQSLIRHKMPFEIIDDPIYGGGNKAYLDRAIAALDAGKGATHELIEVDD